MKIAKHGNVQLAFSVGNWECGVEKNIAVLKGVSQDDCVRVDRSDDVSPRTEILRMANSGNRKEGQKQ